MSPDVLQNAGAETGGGGAATERPALGGVAFARAHTTSLDRSEALADLAAVGRGAAELPAVLERAGYAVRAPVRGRGAGRGVAETLAGSDRPVFATILIERADREAIAGLVEVLRRSRALERSVVSVVGLRGAPPGDGGLLPESELHVGWWLRAPGVDGEQRVSLPASIVDVAPTLLGVLGVESPPRADGIDLQAALSDRGSAPRITSARDAANEAEVLWFGDFRYSVDPTAETAHQLRRPWRSLVSAAQQAPATLSLLERARTALRRDGRLTRD
jgi:hypothetical protein